MELIDNTSKTLRDDLSAQIKEGSKLSIAAACFSIYAFQELKKELKNIDELRFIFTSPTFTTEKAKKEKREFYIYKRYCLNVPTRNILFPQHSSSTFDIVTIHSTQSRYFIASRKFELPELKLLIDAVESSKFITNKKSDALIEKIYTLTSPGQVSKLKRNNYVVDRIKPDNEQIYYIVDAINDAINTGKQISFQYYDYTGLKKKVLKNKGEVYKLSPYNLLWNGDYYYVVGYSEKREKVVTFRVDRIATIPEILKADAAEKPEGFDLAEFTKEVFFMYDGDSVTVDLRCDNSLMKTMIDRFGEDVTTLAYDMTSFRLITEVSASQTFFGWVFGFGGKVRILAPENVKEQYKQMIMQANENIPSEQ